MSSYASASDGLGEGGFDIPSGRANTMSIAKQQQQDAAGRAHRRQRDAEPAKHQLADQHEGQ